MDDYVPVDARTVIFNAGEGTSIICIPVTLIDDDLLEGEEFFPLMIDSVTSPSPGARIGDRRVTTVFIRDNDGMILLLQCSIFIY